LIQLREALPHTQQGIHALKESLWTNMAAANLNAPAHAQVHKDYIIFATEAKPFILAGKETVLRAMTVKLYENEINEFYASQELRNSHDAPCIDVTSSESIQEGIHALLCQILGVVALATTDDIFVAGLDSLSVFKVLASLRATLQSAGQMEDGTVTAGLIYANPSVEKLSGALSRLVQPDTGAYETTTTVQLMGELLEKYTSGLPNRPSSTTIGAARCTSVILTGSTGSLGSYLLDALLSMDNISRVFCLNRSADAQERQSRANSARGLKSDLSSTRVKFIKADLSKPRFGLDSDSYSELLHETTHIIRESITAVPKSQPLTKIRQSVAG
jgi:hypothetical protein